MANQRHDSMTAISISLDRDLLSKVEMARVRSRKDRSSFIREAIAEKMRSMGIDVPDDLLFPPDLRIGRLALNESDSGGPPAVQTPTKKVKFREIIKKMPSSKK